MTSYNITPISPAPLPYQYVANYGQAYDFYGLSGQGCVDTVFSTTYNGVAYIKSVPVVASEAIALVQEANAQLGPYFQVCQSLAAQAGVSSTSTSTSSVTSSSNPLDLFPQLGSGNWIVDDAALVFIVVVIAAIGKWIWDIDKRRR